MARRLGVLDDLVAAGGHRAPFFNLYAMGTQTEHRPFPDTTPSGEASLNMYHPDLQEALLAGAKKAGADVKRGANVHSLSEKAGTWTVEFVDDSGTHAVAARLAVGADGRASTMREWGGFTVKRDPEHLRIAGTLVHGTASPTMAFTFRSAPDSVRSSLRSATSARGCMSSMSARWATES